MPVSRPYEAERDRDHALRIWREVGWIENKTHEEAMDHHFAGANVRVVDQDGEAEALVASTPAVTRIGGVDLPASCVVAVTVSRIARRRGYATRATAELIAEDAANGAAISSLGIFDQGFYDKLGYGTGSPQCFLTFDPATLKVPVPSRTPSRLGLDDYHDIHNSRFNRLRYHGGTSLSMLSNTRSEMMWTDGPYGLGFYCDDGEDLRSHLWISADSENGPWKVDWYAYRDLDELMELLGVLKSLSDQVRSVCIPEPPAVHFEDLLERPFRSAGLRRGGAHKADVRYMAWWQMRVCDLPQCVAALALPGADVAFNVSIEDPIEGLCGGDWTVRLGEASEASKGSTSGLPTLRASVGAFTRLLLGVLPATSLAAVDRLDGDASLLGALDGALRLPTPRPDWPF